MGLQRSPSYKPNAQPKPIPETKNEENKVNGYSTTNEPIFLNSSYNSWVVEHPSALRSFDGMMKATKGKRIVVFLDYDGTLSPIVNDPELAIMSNEMRKAVCKVAKKFPTAIISGRCRDKVKEFVKLSNVCYAGSHGMDIMAPPRAVKSSDGKNHNISPDKKIYRILEEKTKTIQGARVEDNRFCISVHYRQVRDEDYGMLEETVKSVVETYQEFHVTEGKKVLEVRPSIEWNKGHALEYLLETLGFSNSSTDVLPFYIGDDRSDEDAFKVIRRRGHGYPIIVSSIPKDTGALYSLCDPSEVLTFLKKLAGRREKSSSYRTLARFRVKAIENLK
ncbi:probable trehalose-phosphate phosphatase 4 isoform X2 [Quercus suber]|uniref:probable trehalose-phosphate phosphatase 4 isoform X2 n=1 Tax=Quercus suber TaxID=58331 RepID=UPI0032DE7D5C